jgi:imidazoleglycerol phosphate dehydratase HisB
MFREIRTKVKNLSEERVELERVSKEFRIDLAIDFSKKPGPVDSGLAFVDSLLKNTNFSVEISKQVLETREMIENIGFAMGEGLRKLHEKRKAKQSSSFIQSGEKRMCMIAIHVMKQPGEANLQIIGKPEFDPEHFFAFFDGFSQGFRSEVNAVINLGKGKNHLEFISKAFGSSIEQIFV